MTTPQPIHPLALRNALRLTQPEMARHLGLATRTVARCEANGLPARRNRTRRAYDAALAAIGPLAAPLLGLTDDDLADALDFIRRERMFQLTARDAHAVRADLADAPPLPPADQDWQWVSWVAEAATRPAP